MTVGDQLNSHFFAQQMGQSHAPSPCRPHHGHPPQSQRIPLLCVTDHSTGHTEKWESLTPTRRATPKRGKTLPGAPTYSLCLWLSPPSSPPFLHLHIPDPALTCPPDPRLLPAPLPGIPSVVCMAVVDSIANDICGKLSQAMLSGSRGSASADFSRGFCLNKRPPKAAIARATKLKGQSSRGRAYGTSDEWKRNGQALGLHDHMSCTGILQY